MNPTTKLLITLDPLISRFVALLALIRKPTAVTCFSGTSDPNKPAPLLKGVPATQNWMASLCLSSDYAAPFKLSPLLPSFSILFLRTCK